MLGTHNVGGTQDDSDRPWLELKGSPANDEFQEFPALQPRRAEMRSSPVLFGMSPA